MFQIFILFSTLAFSQISMAAPEPVSLPTDIAYVRDLNKSYSDFPVAVDQALDRIAFLKLPGNGRFFSINAIDQMNRIYISKNDGNRSEKRLVLAKSGFEVTGPFKFNEIYSVGSAWIVHLQTPAAGAVAIYFRGFSLEKVSLVRDDILKTLKATGTTEKKSAIYSWPRFQYSHSLLFPLAFAESSSVPGHCNSGFAKTTGEKTDASATNQLWACAKGFAGGVWDATGGVVFSLVDVAKALVKIKPAQMFERAADDFQQIGNFMADIENSFGNMKSAFLSLPLDVRAKIGCEVLSSVGTSGLIAFFTAGSGSPLLLKSVAQAVGKVSAQLPQSASLAKLAVDMSNKAELAKKSAAMVDGVEETSKELGKQIKDLKEQIKNPTVVQSADAAVMTPELAALLKDRGLLLKLKASDPALYADIMRYKDDVKELKNLKLTKKAMDILLEDLKKNTTISEAQKAATIAYFSTAACTTSTAVRSQTQDAVSTKPSQGTK